jgi:enolase
MTKITKILARQVFDSRGNPTVEVEVSTENYTERAIVPSGASTGVHEALELRDGGENYHGKGVLKAVENVKKIASLIEGKEVFNQSNIDSLMLQLDGTETKSELGANAILGVSMAIARVAAKEKKMPLFKYLNTLTAGREEARKMVMPTPFMNILNGGEHADNNIDFQEYMIAPQGKTFAESMKIGSEIYHQLKKVLKAKGLSTGVGDEGGFAPNMEKPEEPLQMIMQAAKELGYEDKVKIALDVAASEFYQKKTKKYLVQGKEISSDELAEIYKDLVEKYPIISIEDPFDEEDFKAFAKFTKEMKDKIQVVGDDLLVTNVSRIKMALNDGACNALLLKVNQIGSLTEAINAAKMAFANDWNVMVSHRSGETEDSFIADLVVALGSGQIKTGAPCRGERTAKYNQLLRIEEQL